MLIQPFLNENLIKSNQTVAVALSGGKDSTCLLNLLIDCRERLGIKVVALNVEHGIRGDSSILDSLFVKDYCKTLNIPLRQKSVDVVKFSAESGMSIEEGARKLRYEFFYSAIDDGFCDVVCTAHHLSDVAETVLFNLFRGASPSGLTGIPEISANGKIIRPLLKTPKEDIDAYVESKNIPFVTDETNFSTDYSRNFLRLEIIPLIKSKFPEMEQAITRFTEILTRENSFWDLEVEKSVHKEKDCIWISDTLNDAIYSRSCVVAMKEMGIVKDYEKAHIDALIDLKSAHTGKQIHLPENVVAIKDYKKITFYKRQKVDDFCFSYQQGEVEVGQFKLNVSPCKERVLTDKKSGVLRFDGDKIPDGAVIRNRKRGDWFTKFGGGTKSLGDYLTNKKVLVKDRDCIPLIAIGDEVLVVCGVEISDKIKIDEQTKNIIEIQLEKGDKNVR